MKTMRIQSTFNKFKYIKKSFPDTFNTVTHRLPCIYLIKVQPQIYKYGYTNDLHRRFHEHCRKYGSDISLIYHTYINDHNLRYAEADVREFFNDHKFSDINMNSSELVKLQTTDLHMVEMYYKSLYQKYNHQFNTIIEQNKIFKQLLNIV